MSVDETKRWIARLDAVKAAKEIPREAKEFIEKCKNPYRDEKVDSAGDA